MGSHRRWGDSLHDAESFDAEVRRERDVAVNEAAKGKARADALRVILNRGAVDTDGDDGAGDPP